MLMKTLKMGWLGWMSWLGVPLLGWLGWLGCAGLGRAGWAGWLGWAPLMRESAERAGLTGNSKGASKGKSELVWAGLGYAGLEFPGGGAQSECDSFLSL